MIDWNEGNGAASGRGRSPSPRFVGGEMDASGARSSQHFGVDVLMDPRGGLKPRGCFWLVNAATDLPRFFSGERFSDGMAVRFTDVTTCYPGQPSLGAAAHDGIVRNRHKVRKRARPTYQPALGAKNLNGPRAVFRKGLWEVGKHPNRRVGFNLGSLSSRAVRGCVGPSANATGQ